MNYIEGLFKNKFLFLLIFFFGLNSLCFANFNKATFTWYGRAQFDYVIWLGAQTNDLRSGPSIKIIDLFVKGLLDNNLLSCFLHLSFLDAYDLNHFSQGYIKYGSDKFIVKLGQIIVPLGLEQAIDSGNKIFMEAASIRGIDENKYFGFSMRFVEPLYAFSVSFIGPQVGNPYYQSDKPKYSMLMRATTTINPLKNSGISHLGISYKISRTNMNYAQYLITSVIGFRDNPSFANSSTILNTYASTLPKHYVFGLEYLNIVDSLLLQSEFFYVKAYWRYYDEEAYYSWYAQLSYILTGESRRYNRSLGSVSDPKPSSDYGLLEFAIRYNHTNLVNTGPFLKACNSFDGYKDSLAFAMNWIVNSYIKLQFNYASESHVYRVEERGRRNVSGLGMRVQFMF